ncbi:hypothetical protein HOY80DRAFT_1076025 [Tuber brumale]|nr:hypothetical protein HOY80DRAFT_1076025 [Tuber brumale]
MFPPRHGNDNLDAGGIYLINLFGTNQVLTVGEELCLEEYKVGHRDKMWVSGINPNYGIGMRNSFGGHSLCMMPPGNDSRRAIQHINGNIPYLKVGKVPAQFGLHKLGSSVFRRFPWVVPGRLARSPAPYFDSENRGESINETSIEFHKYEISVGR